MQISSRFTLAVHMLMCVETFKDEYHVTSEFIASSTNVNPVIIRKILLQLKNAGLIVVTRGNGGGTTMKKPLSEITFLDIYKAVECVEDNTLFHFHEKPNEECPVGKNIHNIMDDKLERVQKAMEDELRSITLEEVKKDLNKYLSE